MSRIRLFDNANRCFTSVSGHYADQFGLVQDAVGELANVIGGNVNTESSKPISDGFRSITAHEQIHFQKSFTACFFSRHFDVSPPS